jgi:hypothetical protein
MNLPYAKNQVVIEVSGGVAEVMRCPDGIEVLIIDHDNEINGGYGSEKWKLLFGGN